MKGIVRISKMRPRDTSEQMPLEKWRGQTRRRQGHHKIFHLGKTQYLQSATKQGVSVLTAKASRLSPGKTGPPALAGVSQ